MALEQNPNGFRHLYGTTDLDAVQSRPVEWEELDETEKAEKGDKREGEEEEGDMEGDGEEEAVDQFLADAGLSDDEGDQPKEDPSTYDPDFIPTPLMQQFKVYHLHVSLTFNIFFYAHTLIKERATKGRKQRASHDRHRFDVTYGLWKRQ